MSNLTMINLEVGSWMQLTFISKLLSKKPVFKEGFLVLCRFSCDSCDTSFKGCASIILQFPYVLPIKPELQASSEDGRHRAGLPTNKARAEVILRSPCAARA